MIEVTDFEEQVLKESHSRPVLVDFWAPWCGPCRQLGPVLERLESEDGAPFLLAKLNTDEDPTTAGRYAIRSIPAVKLFVDGRVSDEFIGALPEAQVRRWLELALPSESRRLILQARDLLEAGDEVEAESLLAEVLETEPRNADAAIFMSRLLLFRDRERAATLARTAVQLDRSHYELGEAIWTIAELAKARTEGLPEDAAKQAYVEAIEALDRNDLDSALSSFVQSVRVNRKYHVESARRACLALFVVLGRDDPLTRKHQRALEMALF